MPRFDAHSRRWFRDDVVLNHDLTTNDAADIVEEWPGRTLRLLVRLAVRVPPFDLRFVAEEKLAAGGVANETERAELQIADDVGAVVASIKKKENPFTIREHRDAGNEAHLAVERPAGLVELDDVVRISFDRFFQSHRRDRLDAEWRSFDVRAKHARDDDRAGPFDLESIRRNDVGDCKRLRGDSEDEQRNLGGQGVTMGRRAAYARNGDHAAG